MIVIVGLGPGTLGQLSVEAWEALQSAKNLWLRTAVHPTARSLEEKGIKFNTFDAVYESQDCFDDVYQHIVTCLLKEEDVTYAVPGHPLIGEQTVELLKRKACSETALLISINASFFNRSGMKNSRAGVIYTVWWRLYER
jgi:tetrapyrrole methylase family protein/MazG family protein